MVGLHFLPYFFHSVTVELEGPNCEVSGSRIEVGRYSSESRKYILKNPAKIESLQKEMQEIIKSLLRIQGQ